MENAILKQLVEDLESPFKWMPKRSDFSHVSREFLLQRNTIDNDDTVFKKYMKYLRVVFELSHLNATDAEDKMTEWKSCFLVDDPMIYNCSIVETNYLILKQVLLSTEANLVFKARNYPEAEQILNEIEIITNNVDGSSAALYGIQASFFDQFGYGGHMKALPLAKQAMELDPAEPMWPFMTAKTKRDIRRSEQYNNENKEELEEELGLFRTAVEMKRKPVYLVHLANSHIDLATHQKWQHKRQLNQQKCRYPSTCIYCKEIANYCNKAAILFKEVIGEQRTFKMILKVLQAVNKIPGDFNVNQKEIAAMCVEYILTVIDGQVNAKKGEGYLAIGKFYQNIKKDNKEAEKYFRLGADCECLSAEKEVIVLDYNKEGKDPTNAIITRMNKYPDRLRKIDAYSQIVLFSLYVQGDLLKAIDAMEYVLEYDPELTSVAVKKPKSWFFWGFNKNSLLQDVLQEIFLSLEDSGEGQGCEIMHNFLANIESSDYTRPVLNEISEMFEDKNKYRLKSILKTKRFYQNSNRGYNPQGRSYKNKY